MYYRYNVTINAKNKNAIGVTSEIEETILSDCKLSENEILLRLYDKYDHITPIKIESHYKPDGFNFIKQG